MKLPRFLRAGRSDATSPDSAELIGRASGPTVETRSAADAGAELPGAQLDRYWW